MNTVQIIDIAKERAGIPSDNQLALRLGIKRNTISSYRRRGNQMDDDIALKVAPLVGMDEGEILAHVHAERATDLTTKAAWLRVAETLKKAQGVAVILSAPALALSLAAKGFQAFGTAAYCILC